MKNKLSAKNIIILVIAVLLFVSGSTSLFLISIMIFIYVIIDLKKNKVEKIEKKEKEQEKLEIIDNREIEQLRAGFAYAEEKHKQRIEFKKSVDVRQFQGRNDVTREEVEKYMFTFTKFVGFEKQQDIMDRIKQVCNFNESDKRWVTHEIWGKTRVEEDKEMQRYWEYEDKKRGEDQIKLIKQMKEWAEYDYKINLINCEKKEDADKRYEKELKKIEEYEKHETYRINYDLWLKKNGYI